MREKTIPSTDIYFLNACAHLVGGAASRKPIRQMGANSFKCENRYLVVRKDNPTVLKKILSDPKAEIIYLIDDDLDAAIADVQIPSDYRARLSRLKNGPVGDILARAKLVLVPSKKLEEKFSKTHKVLRLNPFWLGDCPDDSHYGALTDEPVNMVHLGTASHDAAFKFLSPVLEKLIEAQENFTFTYHSNKARLGPLDAAPQIKRRRVISWQKYKRQLGNHRYHLGLYPILDTPFNQARSRNKILEYSLAGCPAVYSKGWEHAGNLASEAQMWLADNDVEAWFTMLRQIMQDRSGLSQAYGHCRKYFTEINDEMSQLNLWQDILVRGNL